MSRTVSSVGHLFLMNVVTHLTQYRYVFARTLLLFVRSNLQYGGDCFAAKTKSAARNDISFLVNVRKVNVVSCFSGYKTNT